VGSLEIYFTFKYGGLGSLFGGQEDIFSEYDNLITYANDGRWSKIPFLTFSVGIENDYVIILAIAKLFEGISSFLYYITNCKNGSCLLYTFRVFLGIEIFMLFALEISIIIAFTERSVTSFSNPTFVYLISLILDATIVVVVASYLSYVLIKHLCKDKGETKDNQV